MSDLNRRSALALFSVATAAPLVGLATPAAAEMYGPNEGKEIMPGTRQVDLGEYPVSIGGYKKAVVTDYVTAPGGVFPVDTMKNDMICHILEGQYWVKQNDWVFTAKAGHVFTCATGMTEEDKNTGTVTAIMRVTDLLTA